MGHSSFFCSTIGGSRQNAQRSINCRINFFEWSNTSTLPCNYPIKIIGTSNHTKMQHRIGCLPGNPLEGRSMSNPMSSRMRLHVSLRYLAVPTGHPRRICPSGFVLYRIPWPSTCLPMSLHFSMRAEKPYLSKNSGAIGIIASIQSTSPRRKQSSA